MTPPDPTPASAETLQAALAQADYCGHQHFGHILAAEVRRLRILELDRAEWRRTAAKLGEENTDLREDLEVLSMRFSELKIKNARLRADKAELSLALTPFSKVIDLADISLDDKDEERFLFSRTLVGSENTIVTIGDLRRARAVLAKHAEGGAT